MARSATPGISDMDVSQSRICSAAIASTVVCTQGSGFDDQRVSVPAAARPRDQGSPRKHRCFRGLFHFRTSRFGSLANSLIRTSAVMDRTRGPGILERISGRAIGSGHFGSVHQGPSGHDRRCRMRWRRRGPRGRWRLAHVVVGANRTSAGLWLRAISQGHRLRWRCSATRSTRTGRATGGASIASAAGSRRWLSSPIVSHRARDKQFASTSGA